jgi:putative transposase
MCPKDTWLAARNLNHAWPMFGRPQLLVTDSAMEFKGHAFQRGCDDYGIRIRYRDRGRVHHGGVVERLLGKLNAVLATYPGSSGRSVAHRDEYPSERRACLSFADLERCVALAVIDHNLQANSKTLRVPMTEWQRNATALPRFDDDPQRVLLSFLPGTERQLSPQGISMFAMHYYSPWLSAVVPERDRLGRLEVRYDPRDISRVYVRDPETRLFRPVERRDGQLTSVTLWEHAAERSRRRAANHRSSTEKVALRREIAAIVQSAKPSRRQLRNAARNVHAAAAEKPYAVMQPPTPPPAEHPPRQKSRLPVEDW